MKILPETKMIHKNEIKEAIKYFVEQEGHITINNPNQIIIKYKDYYPFPFMMCDLQTKAIVDVEDVVALTKHYCLYQKDIENAIRMWVSIQEWKSLFSKGFDIELRCSRVGIEKHALLLRK